MKIKLNPNILIAKVSMDGLVVYHLPKLAYIWYARGVAVKAGDLERTKEQKRESTKA
jgi:hypothetical protein